jgi:hypothetical protein
MEFAEWVVSGLDQLRLGQLPAGNNFYDAASTGLGGDPRLAAYMNSGDPAARAELVQLITAAVAANPGFEQQLRAAAATAQGGAGGMAGGAAGGKQPFLKTTNGLLVLVAAAVVVVGGGIGLAVGLGGDGNLASVMKGTWTCNGTGPDSPTGGPVSFTVGDGTWSAGTRHGTWTQSGSSGTLTDATESDNDLRATGLPSGSGSFDIALTSPGEKSQVISIHIQGTVSEHKLTLSSPFNEPDLQIICTK